jgi:superfamily II DNA or RNA helicase
VNNKVAVSYAGVIPVSTKSSPLPLWPHQQEAIAAMNAKILANNKQPFAGLLVIPTGGGKTLIAVRWLLRNVIDHKKKVLWIAHRHELLEQAFLTVKNNAYAEGVLPHTKSFRYRIISGQHGRPVNVQPDDDIVIASKDSLNRGLTYLLDNWLASADEVFLVIDEAHHATAKTYRKIVDALQSGGRVLRVLGLTATPFRTLESEQGLLGKVFVDDIIYKVDLRTLIARGILAEPIFEKLETNLNLARQLTDQDLKTIEAFDELPEHIARQIAESSERNARIVSHYVQNQAKYGQLLVFAVNVAHAISLNGLFNEELNRFFKTKGQVYSGVCCRRHCRQSNRGPHCFRGEPKENRRL